MQDFLYKVTADGWVGFIGAIIGAVITALSILVAIQHNRKQIKQQNISMLIPYCEALLKSLPSYDALMTQADYLDETDNLLGGFTSSEQKLHILENKLENASNNEEKELLEYKVKKQKEYLEYWNKANKKIDNFMSDGYYNAVKSACDSEIISLYYEFIVAFRNEHFYCGPVIDTSLLRTKLVRLMEEINRAKE